MTDQHKPEITLKSIKLHEGLSEETPAYTATLCVDGKPFCLVSNAGHGGGDDYHPLKNSKTPHNVLWDQIKALDERIADTYPKTSYGEGDEKTELDETLECLCHGLAWRDADFKRFKRMLSRKIVFIKNGGVFTINRKWDSALLPAFTEKHPTAELLNTMAPDAAFEKVAALES